MATLELDEPSHEEDDAFDNHDAPEPTVTVGFDELGLSEAMLETLDSIGYATPSPVQAGVIPVALSGRDVLGQARTGTGKTAAFAIPILETYEERGKGAPPQAIVLVPTRELAVQVAGEFQRLAGKTKIRCVAVYGGKPIKAQIGKLERGADVVIGTPGRVLDHIGRRTIDLRSLRVVVLDEADRMLDIGFRPDIEKILRQCPSKRQTMLLSATVAPPVKRLAERYMHEPVMLDFSPKSKSVDTIEQHFFTVDADRKFDLLNRLLEREKPAQTIVFCRTKRGCDKIFERLSRKRKGIGCIHGDLPQGARDKVMKEFRAEEITLLVATDVVGRGIDVSSISHIVNYDIPQSSDDYVHRVGRTGRMGRDGVAYTFVTREEGEELTRIEVLINKQLIEDRIEGFEAARAVEKKAAAAVQYFGAGAAPAVGAPAPAEGAPAPAEGAPPPAESAPAPAQAAKPKPPGARGKRHRRAL